MDSILSAYEMENSSIVKEFIELAKIDTFSRQERAIVDVVKKKLENLGCTVTEDDAASKIPDATAGNVFAVLEGELPGSILFCAHLDRVQNGFGIKPQIKDGIMTSDGTTILAADDLSGVAAILDGLRRIRYSGQKHPRIEILFSVCEEIGLRGSYNFDASVVHSKFGFVLDSPGRIGRILRSAMGKAQLFLEVTGESAHAAYPERGKSALRAAVKVLSSIGDCRVDEETVINWSYFDCPSPCNTIPDHVLAKAFAMSGNNEKLDAYIRNFQETAAQVAEETGCKIDARVIVDYPAFHTSDESICVRLMQKVFENMGVKASVEDGAGGFDANLLSRWGIELVGLSTGYSLNHTVKENLVVEDLYKSGKMVANAALTYAEL